MPVLEQSYEADRSRAAGKKLQEALQETKGKKSAVARERTTQ